MKTNLVQQNIPSGWQENNLLDCLHIPSKLAGIKLSEYEKEGDFPVFDQGQDYISGFSSKKDLVVKDVPAILFGDHTRVVKYIKSPFVAGADGTKIFWAKDGFDPTFLYYLVLSQKIPNTGYNRHFKFLKDIKVIIPESKTEQQKIAEILGAVDEDIAKTQEVIAATEKLKRGLMQQLFTRGIGHTKFKETRIGQIPEEWEVVSLEDISKNLDNKRIPITKSKRSSGQYPYYGATGIVDYVNDYIFEETLLLISEDGANLKDRNYPIAFTATGKYWVNNHVHIHRFENKFLQKYVQDYLNTLNLEPYLTGMAQPKLNKDRLFAIPLPKPKESSEVKEIAEILSEVDEKISVNKRLKEKLILLKKGLMQDLLSGKVRTKI